MRIAVTGASGFIGSHLVSFLRAKNHTVVFLSALEGDLDALSDVQHIFSFTICWWWGGSIGSAFVSMLKDFHLKAPHILDIYEKALVEVMRDLRARRANAKGIKTFTLDSCLNFSQITKIKILITSCNNLRSFI